MSVRDLAGDVAGLIGGRPVFVALGGGADSAVACWAAVRSGAPVRAGFVDHELAGSGLLDAASRRLCERLGVDRAVLAAPVAPGPDLERRARDVRYRVLADALRPGERLVTGHTMSDQAETVLLQLMRGAGSSGLSAMTTGEAPVLRPLLGWSREQVRSLAMALELPFVDDPANDDPGFARNHLRGEVMPLLRRLRPGVEAAIARSAANLAGDDELLRREAAVAVPARRDETAILLPVPVLVTVHRALAARAILDALVDLDGVAAMRRDVDAVFDLVGAGRRGRVQLSAGRFAEIEGPYVVLSAREPALPGPVRLGVPGTASFGSHRLGVWETPPRPGLPIAATALPAEAVVRTVLAGDRIAIRGGSKLVNDALAEHGVPRRLRRAWPVIVADGKIAAIPGARVAWWARATGGETFTVTDERVPG